MNIVLSGVLAAGLATSALMLSRQGLPYEDTSAAAASAESTSAGGEVSFVLSGPGGRDACTLTRTVAERQTSVDASADCDRLLPGLSGIRVWRERDDGSVALDDAAGRTLAQFAQADGAGYESYQPALPPLSLVREN